MVVPIFPLPNVVLFPKTVMPLHIFEERYRAMTRAAIEGDGTIVMVLLRRGWEGEYHGNPAVHEIACLGKIETYEELEGGKYNLLLTGVQRVRLVREIRNSPYRLAEVEHSVEAPYDEHAEENVRRKNHMGALFLRYTELAVAEEQRAAQYLPQFSLEALVNRVASILNLPAEEKQALLEIDDLTQRCDVLLPVLQGQLEAVMLARRFEHLKPGDPTRN
jgi:uncharacterized protein